MKKLWSLVVIFLFSLVGSSALFHSGLFSSNDIWHNLARFYRYYQAVQDGQFPPYWVGTLAYNYGYPLFFFSYPLPWLIGLPFLKLGFDIVWVIKGLFFLGYFASGVTMYYLCLKLFKNIQSALLGAIAYLWAPYHFLVILVGGSLGELIALAFIPLVLLGTLYLADKNSCKRGVLITSLGIAGLILSNIILIVFTAPLLLALLIWLISFQLDKREFLIMLAKRWGIVAVLTLLLTAFYFIPALDYSRLTAIRNPGGFSTLYQTNTVNLSQLIYSKWGYGPIKFNAKDGEISFQVGIVQWLGVLGLLVLIVLRKIKGKYLTLSLALLVAYLISIFMMLDPSKPLWAAITKVVLVDYPWHFLAIAVLVGSLSLALIVELLHGRYRWLALVAVSLIALYTNRNNIKANLYFENPKQFIESEVTTNTFNEYQPEGTAIQPGPLMKAASPNNPVTIQTSDYFQNTKKLVFNYQIPVQTLVDVRQFAFPGITLYVDNQKTNYTPAKYSDYVSFLAPAGDHQVKVEFEPTTVIIISEILTLIGVAAFIGLALIKKIPA